ncbi:MAG: DUF3857 and transglutaminase domain-containing protein [Cyclobacteriaceae bacterium]|nr:DUF3857 and transglutaminase domain-containing protein [Cyclobacteriaceae bacterium]
MRFVFVLFYGISFAVFSQEYQLSQYPDSIKTGYHKIVHLNSLHFDVLSEGTAIERGHRVVTLLNGHAKYEAYLYQEYGPMVKIKSLNVLIYDASGRLVDKYNKGDFEDYSAYDGFSIFSDSRMLRINVGKYTYPYTIDYSYVIEESRMMFYPGLEFQEQNGYVLKSELEVRVPNKLGVRYKLHHMEEPVIVDDGSVSVYTWQRSNMPAYVPELYEPRGEFSLPVVYTAPRQFEMEGYRGDMSTWEGFAQFQLSLLQGLDSLPFDKAVFFSDLVKGAADDREKIERVYEYLQQNFRYVSISLGIGGWQPFSPEYVDQYKYGDCKALSYYTRSVLESVGIESLYTLINSGRVRPVYEDFPMTNFNHVVLCVPNKGDTVWLECTSQTDPAGYMGRSTYARKAVAITEEGAKIIQTPNFSSRENRQYRSATVEVDEFGDAVIHVQTVYSGLQFENDQLDYLLNDGREKQQKWLYDHIDISNFTIRDFQFSYDKKAIPEANVVVDLQARKLGSVSGKRMFITPNLMNVRTFVPKEEPQRRTDVELSMAYHDIDTIEYVLPSSLSIEVVPQPVDIVSRFGTYHAEVVNDKGKIRYIRSMEINSGLYPRESYEELRQFYQQIVKADKAKLIFRSKT